MLKICLQKNIRKSKHSRLGLNIIKKNFTDNASENSVNIFDSKSCDFCKSNAHFELLKCTEFKNVPKDTRMKFIVKNRVCWRCLNGHHLSFNSPDMVSQYVPNISFSLPL